MCFCHVSFPVFVAPPLVIITCTDIRLSNNSKTHNDNSKHNSNIPWIMANSKPLFTRHFQVSNEMPAWQDMRLTSIPWAPPFGRRARVAFFCSSAVMGDLLLLTLPIGSSLAEAGVESRVVSTTTAAIIQVTKRNFDILKWLL